MENIIVVLTIQSFSDIITNSSSELFVIQKDPNYSVDLIREMLNDMFQAFLKNREYQSYYPNRQSLDDILSIRVAENDRDEDFGRDDPYEGWNIKWKKGDIIIESDSSNTIPGEMMSFIEYWCGNNVIRKHLG